MTYDTVSYFNRTWKRYGLPSDDESCDLVSNIPKTLSWDEVISPAEIISDAGGIEALISFGEFQFKNKEYTSEED